MEQVQDIDPTASAPSPEAEWAIVEILGHRRHVGRVGEAERFGARFLRVDIPIKGDAEANGWRTLYDDVVRLASGAGSGKP